MRRIGRFLPLIHGTLLGTFFVKVDIECSDDPFPTVMPTELPSYRPTLDYPCIYVNWTNIEDSEGGWFGVYSRIYEPEYKNGKVHYTGPEGNELYWMEDGVFGQRWIIACSEGTILAYEDAEDSVVVPNQVLWQQIGFSSCIGHCVDFGNDVNITLTNLPTCPNTSMPTADPTPFPTSYPTRSPTDKPTAFPTKSPSPHPSVMPTPSPTPFPTSYPTRSP